MTEERRYTQEEVFVGLPAAYSIKSKTRPSGTRGEGVFVGIVDTGVNILHEAFMTHDATPKSRIAWFWVLHGSPTPGDPPWTHYGTVFNNTQLDQIIAKVRAGKWVSKALVELGFAPNAATAKEIAKALLDLDEGGAASFHGTGVASIAAGTPWRSSSSAPLYGGVAPDAKLIVVADARKASIEAIEFCFDKAGATPCVVNMSLAGYGLRHDGKDDFHKRVDAALQKEPGRAVVVGAGNSGWVYKHARVTSPIDVTVSVPTLDLKSFTLYLRSSIPVKVSIGPPESLSSEFVESGPDRFGDVITQGWNRLPFDDDENGFLSVAAPSPLLPPPFPPPGVYSGDWTLRFEDAHGGSITFLSVVDVWLDTSGLSSIDDARLVPPPNPPDGSREDAGRKEADGKTLSPVRPKNWIQYTLSSEACGVNVIAVGMISAKGKLGIDPASSRGQPTVVVHLPVPDPPTDSKPDLAAPGVEVRVAYWQVNGKKPIGRSTAHTYPNGMSGTSAAAPWVAGAVALMLSHDPTLKFDRIREILRDKSTGYTEDEITEYLAARDINPLDLIGRGVLHIESALREVTKNNPP